MSKKICLIDGTELTIKELAAPDLHGTPRVMTLLREKQLNPENVSEELLSLKDQSGTSVLNVCIERFKEPVSNENGSIVSRALFLTEKQRCSLPLHFRKVREILTITNENGWSIAHEMALSGSLPKSMMTKEILQLTTWNGCSVAYHAALWNSLPDWAKWCRDILLLGNGQGNYVAHMLAKNGKLPTEMMTPDILKLQNSDGQTVLFVLVSERHLSREILLLPWNEHTKVFEHLCSEQFLRQVQNEETLTYAKEEITKLIQTQSIVELSQRRQVYEEMQR